MEIPLPLLILLLLLAGSPYVIHRLTNNHNSPNHNSPVSFCARNLYGLSGRIFKGEVVRQFDRSKLTYTQVTGVKKWSEGRMCKKWAVSTTIFEPGKALFQVTGMPGWCTVIVLDRRSPANFSVPGAVILGVKDQEQLTYRTMNRIPWNHFGRKNVGFLYAISHGAEVLYDLDDDNEVIPGKTLPENAGPVVHEPTGLVGVFNPYPLYGNADGWPRGLPLDQILNSSTQILTKTSKDVTGSKNCYVLQSLADNDPDYDAIYRLTRRLPVTFDQSGRAVSPGPHSMTPYNAQATIHLKPAFWGLLLPITVHGRVSDIWRSYFTQRILWEMNGRIAFLPPWAIQYRNPHSYLADFDSELDLYLKATALVNRLLSWRCPDNDLLSCVMALQIDMYERKFIEEGDVLLMYDWLMDLQDMGYVLPTLSTRVL